MSKTILCAPHFYFWSLKHTKRLTDVICTMKKGMKRKYVYKCTKSFIRIKRNFHSSSSDSING